MYESFFTLPATATLRNVLLWLSLSVTFISTTAWAATLPSGFTETQFGGMGANMSNPTAMAFAPDGRLFVCQQTGSLRVIKNGALLATPFLTVSVNSSGERGLLGVAFDPNFAANQFIYVYYTTASAPIHNRVSRFTANGDVALAGETILLELDNLSSATNHNGGALHFGPDGKLYIAVGENATAANAQSFSNLLGKMLRINADGSIPPDNPFLAQTTGRNQAIWALGLRNPFTFNFQPGTGRMFINDVGQNTWEEINAAAVGANYGWPTCEGTCGVAGFTNPIHQYANNASTCAITGGTFYNPATVMFPAQYVGKYFFADFCAGWLRYLDPANNNVADFATALSSAVDLQVGPDGGLYYLQRGGGGQVWRIAYDIVVPPAPKQHVCDFDGDGKTDFSIWRGSIGSWQTLNSSNGGLQATPWGSSAAPYFDVAVPGDYDGDGKTDQAIWRGQDAIWYVRKSSDGQPLLQFWGASFAPYFDVPTPGDFDGDGKTDFAVWRPGIGTFYVLKSSDGGVLSDVCGAPGDTPVVADYDGDGKADFSVWRPSNGTWYVKRSAGGTDAIPWGAGYAPYFDVPVPADYDGDGKTDLAIWRGQDSIWYIRRSSDAQPVLQFFGANYAPYFDVPTPGDYDGDGKADVAVWRPTTGTWYVLRSDNGGVLVQQHGQAGDTALPATGVR